MKHQKRPMLLNGKWYRSSSRKLEEDLSGLIASAPSIQGNLFGAVLPHAGLSYSGRGMAPFFANIKKQKNHIILMAPSHYFRLLPDHLYFSTYSSYETPLGDILAKEPGTDALLSELYDDPLFIDGTSAIEQEHAVELFLPFIKSHFENPYLTVLLVPSLTDFKTCKTFSDQILDVINRKNLTDNVSFIASSDFTHYGSRFGYQPFGTELDPELYKKVKESDHAVASLLASGEVKNLIAYKKQNELSVCGINPALLLSQMMKCFDSSGVLADYYNSNEIESPSEDFVSYASLLFGQIGGSHG